MFSRRMIYLLRTMMAAGEVAALPARVTWPVHRALAWLGEEAWRRGTVPSLTMTVGPDPDACVAVDEAEHALETLVHEGFLVQSGTGYTARWAVDLDAATVARRGLLREDPVTAALLVQAGQRLATWASTALKNADTAAASWAFTVIGTTPVVRQPPLVALR
jgi:hypothetical protein